MNIEVIRRDFEAFCGTERFNKFVDVFQRFSRHKQALRFWQERLWSEFCDQRQVATPSADDIESLIGIFDICPLHRVELHPDKAPIAYGLVRFEPQFTHARDTQFPFDNSVVYGGCVVRAAKDADVMYCPECREAYKMWAAQDVLPDVEIQEVISTDDGHVIACFSVPYQAVEKVVPGMKLFLLPPSGKGCSSSIVDLERSRDCFNDGSSGLKGLMATLSGIDSASQIPVGTMLSFNQGPDG